VFGVFADQPHEQVARIAQEAGLDIVQLSGREGMDSAKHFPDIPVVKAVHVGQEDTAESLNTTLVGGGPAMALLDTKDVAAMGGTGKAFDWSVAVAPSAKFPFFLAGGLMPSNVGQAVAQVTPFGVDVSSGVETDGVKDVAKITDFIRNAKTRSE